MARWGISWLAFVGGWASNMGMAILSSCQIYACFSKLETTAPTLYETKLAGWLVEQDLRPSQLPFLNRNAQSHSKIKTAVCARQQCSDFTFSLSWTGVRHAIFNRSEGPTCAPLYNCTTGQWAPSKFIRATPVSHQPIIACSSSIYFRCWCIQYWNVVGWERRFTFWVSRPSRQWYIDV